MEERRVMINLAKRVYYISNNLDFNGVLIFSIIRQFDRFLVNLELKKFLKIDQDIISVIYQQIIDNSMSTNFLKLVDMETEYSENFEIVQIDQICDSVLQQIRNIKDQDKKYIFKLLNIQIIMDYSQIRRLYQDLKSVVQNHIILEAIYKMNVQKSVPPAPPIKEKISSYKQDNNSLKDDKNDKKLVKTELTIIDHIISFSVSPILTISLFYQVLTYYQFVGRESVNFSKDNDILTITIPPVIPIDHTFNDLYYMNLIISLIHYKSDNINHYVTRLVHAIFENKKDIFNDPLNCMMVFFLLFSYFLRYLYETRSLQLIEKFQEWTSSEEIQERIINHHIKIYYPELENKLFVKIKQETDKKIDNLDDERIKNIGEKYSHIIPISEKRFADKVFSELLETNTPFDFKFNQNRVLDLNILRKITSQKVEIDDKFFNKKDLDRHTEKIVLKLLDYNFSDDHRILTLAYKQLVDYIKNPQGFLITHENNLPQFMEKLFPFLEETLNTQNFPQDTITTFDYYFKICNNLPDAKLFTHLDILYLVFQIVIPYYYDVYGIETFIDNLLF